LKSTHKLFERREIACLGAADQSEIGFGRAVVTGGSR
jgi:hypothetical protein